MLGRAWYSWKAQCHSPIQPAQRAKRCLSRRHWSELGSCVKATCDTALPGQRDSRSCGLIILVSVGGVWGQVQDCGIAAPGFALAEGEQQAYNCQHD